LIRVNAYYQTEVPHIYAVGDVIGPPALASTSREQARVAIAHAFGDRTDEDLSSLLPSGIFTIPEVSMIGESEETLAKKGVGRAVQDRDSPCSAGPQKSDVSSQRLN
jgi:NAD(P) transhydrogenase